MIIILAIQPKRDMYTHLKLELSDFLEDDESIQVGHLNQMQGQFAVPLDGFSCTGIGLKHLQSKPVK